MKGTVIAARGMSAGYGPAPVVRDVDLEVRPGEVVALLGANGAGKTTTLLTLAGELRPTDGEVAWRGAPTRRPLHRLAREGLAYVTEERSVFMGLTVRENLRLGRCSTVDALALMPELEPLLDRQAGLLSGGEQQMLTLARALAAAPACLLADEISLGLAPLIVDRLFAVVRTAAQERGVGVLLVEQQARRALAVADRAYVMSQGRIVHDGTGAELLERPDVIEAIYLSQAST